MVKTNDLPPRPALSLLVLVFGSLLAASALPEITLRAVAGFRPDWLVPAQAAVLAAGLILCLAFQPFAGARGFLAVLVTITLAGAGSAWLGSTPDWLAAFPTAGFPDRIVSSVLLKLLTALPVVIVLLLATGTRQRAFLGTGDLSVKADRIGWLGIEGGRITWKKLVPLAWLCITPVTILLSLVTVIGFTLPQNLERLPAVLPVILVLAAGNAFAEGILYRNAVLGSLGAIMPKAPLLLLAAFYFGIAHVDGIPGGPFGAMASGLLGWFLCRAMYETGGFLAPWLIHLMLDTAIFTTMFLLW